MSGQRSRISRSESLPQQVARNVRNDIAAGVLRDGRELGILHCCFRCRSPVRQGTPKQHISS